MSSPKTKCLSGAIKCLVNPNWFIIAIMGQSLAALSNLFTAPSPGIVSAVWFPTSEGTGVTERYKVNCVPAFF